MHRRVSIAIPARNEAERIGDCLGRIAASVSDCRVSRLTIVVLANNCQDDTVARARAFGSAWRGRLEVLDLALPADRANPGWARRLALDAATEHLSEPGDVLMSTDADTLVAGDWITRTIDHLDKGYGAVAGLARLNPSELRALPPRLRRRMARIQRYDNAMSFLKAGRDESEPWPRHFYEGGASIALTHRAYAATGGAPTPTVGEDKALFDAVRRTGGAVRHPTDVRVRTSPRLTGRARGGTSDTLAQWGRQGEDEPIDGLMTISATLGVGGPSARALSFRNLDQEAARARGLVRAARQARTFARAG